VKRGKRLERLYPALTAKERAILTLQDFKAGREQDHKLLSSAPEKQADEFNRYIGLMNAANGELGLVIAFLKERVEQEELRLAWLETTRLYAGHMWVIRGYFNLWSQEAITESDYRKLEEAARREKIPVEDCATVMAEEHDGWDDADLETVEGERLPTDEAWYRFRDTKVRELRELAGAGTIRSSGKGRRLKLECGSFYDWLGEPVPVVPNLGVAFDVRPDADAALVRRRRGDHELVERLLRRSACAFELPLDMESPLCTEPPVDEFSEEIARILAVRLRSGIVECWRELRAVELKLDELIAEFDGEDVLRPSVRERLEQTKASLADLHEQVQVYTGPFELAEPNDELLGMVDRIVGREMGNGPTR
jgi:hypothetical protein